MVEKRKGFTYIRELTPQESEQVAREQAINKTICIGDYATALIHLPREWHLLPYDELRVVLFRGRFIIAHPDKPPMIFNGVWSPFNFGEHTNG